MSKPILLIQFSLYENAMAVRFDNKLEVGSYLTVNPDVIIEDPEGIMLFLSYKDRRALAAGLADRIVFNNLSHPGLLKLSDYGF
jgi:hypothetical protein